MRNKYIHHPFGPHIRRAISSSLSLFLPLAFCLVVLHFRSSVTHSSLFREGNRLELEIYLEKGLIDVCLGDGGDFKTTFTKQI
uniref:Putative secreted protein n=1 Tax=Anopheles darlingi TaxID=43151 RepID=A0A2M4DR13_ANODA